MHELIGKGFAEVRRQLGLTQEDAARRLQGRGLTAWRTSTVGSLEAGLRRPRLDEVLLMAAALNVSVDRLIPGGDDERVELGDGAEVSPRWIRKMLTGDTPNPLSQIPYAHFPVHDAIEQARERFQAEREYYRYKTAPIREHAEFDDHFLTGEDEHRMFDPPTDAERHAARRLGVDVPILKYTARTLFKHLDFDEERDRRIGDLAELPKRSRQARRGLITREMLAEIGGFLDRIGFDREKDNGSER